MERALDEKSIVFLAMCRFFGAGENTMNSSRKRRRTVLCFVHGVDVNMAGVMCQLEGLVTSTSDVTTV